MVLDALGANDVIRRDHVSAEIIAVLHDAAGEAWAPAVGRCRLTLSNPR
jgi:hypothetical protein